MKRIGSDLNLGRLLLLVAICFSLSFDSAQANPNFEQNYGKVKRLYVEAGGVYFSLTGGVTAMKPVNGYYFIPKTHQSYADLVLHSPQVADFVVFGDATGGVVALKHEITAAIEEGQ